MENTFDMSGSHPNRSSAEWKVSTSQQSLPSQPQEENGERDGDFDWSPTGSDIHLRPLSGACALSPTSATSRDAYATIDGQGEESNARLHRDSVQYGIALSTDEKKSDDYDEDKSPHDRSRQPDEQQEGVSEPEQQSVSHHHPHPLYRHPSQSRSLARRLSADNQERLSGRSAQLTPSSPIRTGSGQSGDDKSVHHNELYEKRASKFSEKLTTPSLVVPKRESTLVGWDGPGDPGNPMNWSRRKKWCTTFALGSVTFCVTLASSVFSPGTEIAAREFGVPTEVMVLSTALFILGFAFAPVLWGPMSELYGRKIPMFAVAPNLETLLVSRFLAGFFGCAPLCVVGGAFADFWAPADRGVAVSIFSGATFLGPTMGPVVGGFLTQTPSLGWRWTAWVTLFAAVVFGAIGWLVYDESLGSVLLQRRARKLRYATKDWALHAPADEIEISWKAIFDKYLTKPVKMLVWEPILLLITIHISFIYGILYLYFETYPISFIQQRGWSLGIGSLPFIAVMVGVIIGCLVNYIFIKTRYMRLLKQHGRVPPEERLIPMMVGSILLPIGLFWYAWTSRPGTPWPAQVCAGVPTGAGILLIFLQGINYIIDVYKMFSNSAIAGNTIIRSLFGAGFPMFAIYMYRDLGVTWATSVLGFVSVGLIPVPILFFVYGARIRKMSRFTPKM